MRLIDADALISKSGDWYVEEGPAEGFIGTLEMLINQEPTVQVAGIWIPTHLREPTEEEKKEHPEWVGVYDGRMPDDGDDVLVTTDWRHVSFEEFYSYDDFTSFEDHDDDVVAWAHPIPYDAELQKKSSEGR